MTDFSTTRIFTKPELLNTVEQWRKDGDSIVFTNGCFDILHVGHLQTLSLAKKEGSRLVVGLNSDKSVQRLKGPTRPINVELELSLIHI